VKDCRARKAEMLVFKKKRGWEKVADEVQDVSLGASELSVVRKKHHQWQLCFRDIRTKHMKNLQLKTAYLVFICESSGCVRLGREPLS
jgi:hypothetical protein